MISKAQLSHDNVLDEEFSDSNPFFNLPPRDEYAQRLPPSLRKLLNPVSPLSITTSNPLLSAISPGHLSPSDPKSDPRYLNHYQVINNVHDSELDKASDSTPESSDKGENDFDIRFLSRSNVTSPPWSHAARSSKASSAGTLSPYADIGHATPSLRAWDALTPLMPPKDLGASALTRSHNFSQPNSVKNSPSKNYPESKLVHGRSRARSDLLDLCSSRRSKNEMHGKTPVEKQRNRCLTCGSSFSTFANLTRHEKRCFGHLSQ